MRTLAYFAKKQYLCVGFNEVNSLIHILFNELKFSIMRKFFFLITFITAAMTASAKQYCQEPMTVGDNTILLSCELFGSNYRITIEGENIQGLGGSFFTINESQNVPVSSYATVNEGHTQLVINVASTSVPLFYTPLYVLMPGEVAYGFPNDVEWGKCSQDETKYTITVTQPAAGGTVAADLAEAEYGTVVTLTATPDEGKKLDAWDVKDAENNPVSVSKAGTFVMPQSNVTVTATFKDQVILEPATWSDSDEIVVEEVSYPVTWSITRNADATLTFAIQVTGEVVGFVPEVNVKDAYLSMAAEEGRWAYTTDEEFEDGTSVAGFFWLKYAGGVKRIDWTGYIVGASNQDETAIENVQQSVKAVKVIENGQLFIIKNGVRYNAAGVRAE